MAKRQSLLERYDIDLNKLDFPYIERCNNGNEMEKIYKVLASNEEGYYPELTEAARQKLRQLKPEARCFRTEEPAVKSEGSSTCAEVQEWLNGLVERTNGDEIENGGGDRTSTTNYSVAIRNSSVLEEVPINGKRREQPLLNPSEQVDLSNLNAVERNRLAALHRRKGNNHFRANELQEALAEYNTCLEIESSAVAYNNRAVTYLKLGHYWEALHDCESTLRLDANNSKALLRLAEAQKRLQMDRQSLDTYRRILRDVDPNNVLAIAELDRLKETCSGYPAARSTTALCAADNDDQDDEFARLILPKNMVKSNQIAQKSGERNRCDNLNVRRLIEEI